MALFSSAQEMVCDSSNAMRSRVAQCRNSHAVRAIATPAKPPSPDAKTQRTSRERYTSRAVGARTRLEYFSKNAGQRWHGASRRLEATAISLYRLRCSIQVRCAAAYCFYNIRATSVAIDACTCREITL